MRNFYSCNVLKIAGLDRINSVSEGYLAIISRLYTEFPRGYVEPNVLLHLLYGDKHQSAQQMFKSKLPREWVVFFTIQWHTPEAQVQLRTLFGMLHFCFAPTSHLFIDEAAFHTAYQQFEKEQGKRDL